MQLDRTPFLTQDQLRGMSFTTDKGAAWQTIWFAVEQPVAKEFENDVLVVLTADTAARIQDKPIPETVRFFPVPDNCVDYVRLAPLLSLKEEKFAFVLFDLSALPEDTDTSKWPAYLGWGTPPSPLYQAFSQPALA